MVNAARWAAAGLALVTACGGTKKAAVKIDDGALARLNEQQMQPVDEARIEEGRARDHQARAHAATQDAKAKMDVARAERDVATAQLNRAKAELDMLQKQKADTKDILRAKGDLQNAQDRVKAVDLKIDYLKRMAGVAGLEEQLAAQHAEVAKASTERAKFQALHGANSNEVRDMNSGEVDRRLAEAQVKEAQLRKAAADRRVEVVDAYNKWQELDSRIRSSPTPAPVPTAPAEPIALPEHQHK
jgi:hypothetical protein